MNTVMIDVFEFIEKTNNATCENDIVDTFKKQLERLGFDRIFYTLATEHLSIGAEAGENIINSYPNDWMEHYTKQKYFLIDPVVHHAKFYTAPFVWQDMEALSPFSSEQRRLLNESKDARLFNGVGLGIHCEHNEVAAIGLASSEKDAILNDTNISAVRMIASHMHISLRDIRRKKEIRQKSKPVIDLTRKQIEILQWASQGKTNWEIGTIMHIEHNTVSYHFREIFKKFGVHDRTLAVVIAIKRGLI